MKLFSRKAVAAVATTLALTTAGLSAPAFAEEDGSSLFTLSSSMQDDDANNNDFEVSSTDEGSMSSNPEELTKQVSLFTAIIGALSTVFVFIQRLTN